MCEITRDHGSNVTDDSRRLEQDGKQSEVAERTVRACTRVSKESKIGRCLILVAESC